MPQLHIPGFTEEDLRCELEGPLNCYPQRNRGIIADRVWKTIRILQKEHEKGISR